MKEQRPRPLDRAVLTRSFRLTNSHGVQGRDIFGVAAPQRA